MSFRYVWEKSYESIRDLALSDGPVSERLARAYGNLLRLQSEEDFGGDVTRGYFEALLAQVEGAADDETCASAVRAFSASEQRRAGELMLRLYSELERERGRRDRGVSQP